LQKLEDELTTAQDGLKAAIKDATGEDTKEAVYNKIITDIKDDVTELKDAATIYTKATAA
jgi:hypothetical protein